jgi:hypothetical protein
MHAGKAKNLTQYLSLNIRNQISTLRHTFLAVNPPPAPKALTSWPTLILVPSRMSRTFSMLPTNIVWRDEKGLSDAPKMRLVWT